ncbi:D-glycero-alpha-D-manno-heptose 1-phosphate guanylyltransferase [Nitrosospira sp. Nsp18]|uniref:nucleotidyltransferase family protein n=1 Tax=Nitrosospira sp. Nsp18 TaxID=1855334 RepID=UPI000890F29D|nr:nucleotidyltransferase family protein [Nitrosospira sp. Nsp18]SDA21925.1 D-glycero-alpha-D-manno-heptose 1-phosphate guanylyltransferase [Nitrosospira sp. Nsp18]
MEAIVLAGGLGSRLQQVVPDLPKPMASVAQRPFLEILLMSLSRKGFRRVVLSLGYMAEKIVTYFGDRFAGMELVYEIEDRPLGTGGAVRQALVRCLTNHVFVFNGDTFLDLEVADVEDHWQKHHVPIIVARSVPNTARYGHLEVANGRVLGLVEKGVAGSGLINAGCYVLPINILDSFALGRPFSLEADFLVKVVCEQQFDLFVSHGYFIDIGIPEDYERAQIELARISH